jgi:hypothetical protein
MPTAAAYRPLPHPSEKLLERPYRGCGLSSDWTCYALATLGETTLLPNGRHKSKSVVRGELQRGWDAFDSQVPADSNGWIDQGDMPAIRRTMWPGLPQPPALNTANFDRIVDKLRDGYAVSIALRLSALPASSPLRKYTSADHQVPLYDFRYINGKGYTKRPDPMHAWSRTYTGEWVPVSDVKRAALAFGKVYSWVFPIGGWTAEALMRKRKNAELRVAQHENEQLAAKVADLKADKVEQERTIRRLSTQVKTAKDAGWESALVQATGAIDELRTIGPEDDT